MSSVKLNCFSCGTTLSFVDKIGFREECDQCGEDVHCCRNCHFYDPTAYNECREPSAEVVREKDRNNYCEYFQPGSGEGGAGEKKEDLLSAAEALFKKK